MISKGSLSANQLKGIFLTKLILQFCATLTVAQKTGEFCVTGKERVLKAISHQIPDRVPIGEWGIDHDHVSRIIGRPTYWRNRKEETLALWEGRRDEVVESQKNDCVALVEKLDYDIVTVGLVPPKGYRVEDPPRQIAEGVWEDQKGNRYRYCASNDSILALTHKPPREAISEAEIEQAMRELDHFDPSRFELVDFIGEKFGQEKAVLFRNIDIYDCLMSPFGGDQIHQLIMPLIAPDQIKKLYPYAEKLNRIYVEHCAQHDVLICMQGHDFGMNTGPIMSPDVIRDVYFPLMSRVNQIIVSHHMIPFFHCCGNIWKILDDYIAAGYKGYQSIQESAGMDHARLKSLYGDKLTLWTGVQCETLVSGTLEDTRREVQRNLEWLMPGGGFIFGSTNSVQYGAKTENYLAALEIVKEKGVYS